MLSGYLATWDDYGIMDALIEIKDDDPGPDDLIVTAVTDEYGEFYTTVTVEEWDSLSFSAEIYAVFEGASNLDKSRSDTYSVSLLEYSPEQTYLVLDPLPSTAYVGDTLALSGYLVDGDGYGISGAFIEIKDEDTGSRDELIGTAVTDERGMFFASTPAEQWDLFDSVVEIYAVFEGTSSYGKARSSEQSLSVYKYGSSLHLDKIPQKAREGDIITFSGTLALDQHDPTGAIIYIKDEDTLNPDDLLATAFADENGRFAANWRVVHTDPTSNAEVYAVFEGTNKLQRVVSEEKKLKILDYMPKPSDEPLVSPAPFNYEYMELYFSYDFSDSPRVLIVPEPESYDQVQRHIVSVKEGILTISDQLRQEYGGNWDVMFNVVGKGETFSTPGYEPDVVVNLIMPDSENCKDWAGLAYVEPIKPINTKVCAAMSDKKLLPSDDVARIAAHEFIHAVGLGHTFTDAPTDDMMCSVEEGYGPTCPNRKYRSYELSDLNLASLEAIYGSDGLTNPNNDVAYKQRFSINGVDYPAPTLIESATVPYWIKMNAHSWATAQTNDSTFAIGLEYLIQNGLLIVPTTGVTTQTEDDGIVTMSTVEHIVSMMPEWMKLVAWWWAEDQIDDKQFLANMQYWIQLNVT